MPRRKQRKKGSGSVHKLKGRGWVAQRERPPVDGKRRYERRSFRTKDQADRQVAAWEEEKQAGLAHERAGETAHAWCETWLNSKRGKVEPSTLRFYTRHLAYITPHIGAYQLRELVQSPQYIGDGIDKLTALAPQSRKHVRTVLSMALEQAVRYGIIPRNPCKVIEPPKVEKYKAYALNDAELASFFAVVDGTRLEAMWHLLADFGMRLDEILSSRWPDYDTTAGKLRIRATKNENERYLTLASNHRAQLAAHWDQLQLEREAPGWKEHGYLFPSEVGTKLLQSNVRRAFKEYMAAAKLPRRVRIHDLRHTAATNLIAADNDLATVQYITGHKDTAVLLEIYAHFQGDTRAAVEKVEAKRKKS